MNQPPLDPIEIRVLGCLIEKALSTPEYYPLSLNALVNACNQSNNRQPVLALGEAEVNRALDRLRERHLAVAISGGENRVIKFGHRADELLELSRPHLAVLAELLLRGPQTPGELRTRSQRMHSFADLAEVQTCLGELAARPEPLAAALPRQPGFKEIRHAQLLGGGITPPPTDLNVPLTVSLSPETDRLRRLETDHAGLKLQLDDLRREFDEFRRKFE
jgi:hypothetical protein